ncbi:hypothetical protein OH77DRAFT_891312 [Trametes cingulata]|nr:hypothetical protein OH77DRAFT_891312 [Trametes cingulata]
MHSPPVALPCPALLPPPPDVRDTWVMIRRRPSPPTRWLPQLPSAEARTVHTRFVFIFPSPQPLTRPRRRPPVCIPPPAPPPLRPALLPHRRARASLFSALL